MAQQSTLPRLCILAQGRSGSTLLCDLLNSHSQIRCEGEVLGTALSKPRQFLDGRAYRFGLAGQTWGFKAKHFQITKVQGQEDLAAFLHSMVDGGWKLIYLQRENIVKQTISTLVGAETKKWIYKKGEERPTRATINREKFFEFLRGREWETELEQAGLANLPYLHIRYEQDLEFPEKHTATAKKIHDYLGLPHELPVTQMKKSGSRSSFGANLENADEVCNWAIEAGYEEMLEDSPRAAGGHKTLR